MKKGQALIEVMVGMALAAALMPAVVTAFFAARGGTAQAELHLQAAARMRQTKEVLRILKQTSWGNVANNGTYHLTNAGGTWGIELDSAGTPETNLDGLFSRQITLASAYRTPLNQLSGFATGNTLDPSVKFVTITISWDTPHPTNITSSYYLMRLENLTWIQTTVADFTAGIQSGTAITNNEGGANSGEVVLGSGGTALADWCAPSLSAIDYNIAGSANPNAISAQVGSSGGSNQIVAGTGDSANGVALVHLEVSNAVTPIVTVAGTLPDSSPRIKTNAVFVSGDHAYITTDNKHKEVIFVDLNTYAESGYFNAPVNSNGAGIYVAGSLGFVTVDNMLYSFNSGTGALIGSVTLAGIGGRLVVNGNYIFVTETSGSYPLEILTFNPDGTGLSIVGFASAGMTGNGVDVVVNSSATRGYLATTAGRVYVLDTSTKTGSLPTPLGTFDTQGMTPKGVAVATNNKAIVVGTGGSLQYQVIDIENESSPSLCTKGGTTSGGLAIASGVNGVAAIQEEDGDAYSYISIPSDPEIKIIHGGGGGGGGTYATEGYFESSVFSPGYSVMFNRFDVTATAPIETTNDYQVAITNPVAPGTCSDATYSFVGPNKDSSLWFSGSSELPLGSGNGYTNPGECLKYRLRQTTGNTNSTPVFYDITFNYSP